jgi:hypothetical protein
MLTEVVGQSLPPDENGVVWFLEVHTIVGGTGRFAEASGQITILGRANAEGNIQIAGVGVLIR